MVGHSVSSDRFDSWIQLFSYRHLRLNRALRTGNLSSSPFLSFRGHTFHSQFCCATVDKFPDVLDYYILEKEENAPAAHALSYLKVNETHVQFVENVKELIGDHLSKTAFYEVGDSYEECHQRIAFLKHVTEDNDGYHMFYLKGVSIKRESDLQTLFRLTWFRTTYDVISEVNNGRGPVDYKVSRGRKDACLVEFKLANNSSLKRNLAHQVNVYANANETSKAIKVILYFSDAERVKVQKVLKELGLEESRDVVLIGASTETKASGSKATGPC